MRPRSFLSIPQHSGRGVGLPETGLPCRPVGENLLSCKTFCACTNAAAVVVAARLVSATATSKFSDSRSSFALR